MPALVVNLIWLESTDYVAIHLVDNEHVAGETLSLWQNGRHCRPWAKKLCCERQGFANDFVRHICFFKVLVLTMEGEKRENLK